MQAISIWESSDGSGSSQKQLSIEGGSIEGGSIGRRPAASELLLLFREDHVNSTRRARKRYARRLRHAQRRALLRRLSHVTAQLERTPEYRQSLQRLLDLGSQLQSVLDATQRERWLALEEALFDHSSHLQRAYFRAGVEYGRRRSVEALVSGDETADSASAERSHAVRSHAVPSHAAVARAAPEARSLSTRGAEPPAIELEIVSALARWLGKL